LGHHWIFIPSRVQQSGVVLLAGLLVMALVARKLLRSLRSMVSLDARSWRRSRSALGVLLHHNCLEFVLLAPNTQEVSQSITLRDAGDLRARCQNIAELCHTVIAANVGAVSCWIATDHACSTTTTVGARRWFRPTIDAATAGTVTTTLATHLAQLLDTDLSEQEFNASFDEDWLEIARAQSAPAMDYLLLPDEPVAQSGQVRAWLWWTPKEAEGDLRGALAACDLAVTGLVPSGVALYRGLLEIWRDQGAGVEELSGSWALLDMVPNNCAAAPTLWLFVGSRFRHCETFASSWKAADLIALAAMRLDDANASIVLWQATDELTQAATSLHRVFDYQLNPWVDGAANKSPRDTVASVIALGLALQAKADKTSDWHGGQDAPVVNLLPWRGRRLQHMRRSFQVQLVTAACLTLAVMWTWVTALQAQVAEEQTHLVRVQNTYDQALAAQAQSDASRANLGLAERSAGQLKRAANAGNLQLARLHFLLALLPECLAITGASTSQASALVSGVVSNPAAVTSLAADVFAAFDANTHYALDAWPVLTVGERSLPSMTPMQTPQPFSLRLSFAARAAPDADFDSTEMSAKTDKTDD
jgi:hypothetical protein